MKTALFLLTICFSILSIAQQREPSQPDKIILQDTEWKASCAVFEDADKESYSIYRIEPDFEGFDWGHFISFSEKNFSTHYSAPCGNDCFTSINGTYKTIGLNRIEVFVESINRSGFCSEKSEEPKKSYGIYFLTENDNGVSITKER